jgi:hypothetical protein
MYTLNGLESTAESGDFLVRLSDSSRGSNTWSLAKFPSTTVMVIVLGIMACLTTIGSRNRKASLMSEQFVAKFNAKNPQLFFHFHKKGRPLLS